LFLKPSYSKALNILDAQKDNPNLAGNDAHAEFDMFEFYGNYVKKSQIFDTPISYNFSFDGQSSKQTLYGIDKFSIGGISSIRGFKEGTISGDSGYNFRNEVSVNFGQMILPYLSAEKSQSLTQLNRFSISPFYDYGQVRAKNGQTSGRLSGGGFKIGFNHKNFNAALTFSRALSKSKFLGQHYSDNNAIFFNISSELGFF
jgi:hemolysin activation/secretion protein